jgi:hypothetical protein
MRLSVDGYNGFAGVLSQSVVLNNAVVIQKQPENRRYGFQAVSARGKQLRQLVATLTQMRLTVPLWVTLKV